MSLAAASVMMLARIGGALLGAQAVPPPAEPVQEATASYYTLGGTGSCGRPAQIGRSFASLFLPCGAQVEFCYGPTCAVGTMDDAGPYVVGRLFDLNVNLRDALGCPSLCVVRWRRMS